MLNVGPVKPRISPVDRGSDYFDLNICYCRNRQNGNPFVLSGDVLLLVISVQSCCLGNPDRENRIHGDLSHGLSMSTLRVTITSRSWRTSR